MKYGLAKLALQNFTKPKKFTFMIKKNNILYIHEENILFRVVQYMDAIINYRTLSQLRKSMLMLVV